MLTQNGAWLKRSGTTGCIVETEHDRRFSRHCVQGTWRGIVLMGLVILALGCASAPPRENPLPQELYDQSQIPNIPNARYWSDAKPPYADKLMSATDAQLLCFWCRFPNLRH